MLVANRPPTLRLVGPPLALNKKSALAAAVALSPALTVIVAAPLAVTSTLPAAVTDEASMKAWVKSGVLVPRRLLVPSRPAIVRLPRFSLLQPITLKAARMDTLVLPLLS